MGAEGGGGRDGGGHGGALRDGGCGEQGRRVPADCLDMEGLHD